MADADDEGALPPHVARIAAERAARRKHADDADRILNVVQAAGDCGDGRFPYIFEPWRDGDAVHTWSARVDWAAYGPRWISECVVPFVAALRDLASYFSVAPRALLPSNVTAHDKDQSDRMTFTLDQVVRLVDGADHEEVGRHVGVVMQADRDAWRHYHWTFEVIARRLASVASRLERGADLEAALQAADASPTRPAVLEADPRSLPLPDKVIDAAKLLLEVPPAQGLPGKDLARALSVDINYITRDVVEALTPWGLKNRNRVGYYIPADRRPALRRHLGLPPEP